MIDALVTTQGLLSIVHDEDGFETLDAVEVSTASREIFGIDADGSRRRLGRLSHWMVHQLVEREGSAGPGLAPPNGRIVRMQGWRIHSIRSIHVHLV